MSAQTQTATAKPSAATLPLRFQSEKASTQTQQSQMATAQDDYDAKVSLMRRAFREISRLCYEYDCKLTDDDWRYIDWQKMDEPNTSYDELRSLLSNIYLHIKRQIRQQEVKFNAC